MFYGHNLSCSWSAWFQTYTGFSEKSRRSMWRSIDPKKTQNKQKRTTQKHKNLKHFIPQILSHHSSFPQQGLFCWYQPVTWKTKPLEGRMCFCPSGPAWELWVQVVFLLLHRRSTAPSPADWSNFMEMCICGRWLVSGGFWQWDSFSSDCFPQQSLILFYLPRQRTSSRSCFHFTFHSDTCTLILLDVGASQQFGCGRIRTPDGYRYPYRWYLAFTQQLDFIGHCVNPHWFPVAEQNPAQWAARSDTEVQEEHICAPDSSQMCRHETLMRLEAFLFLRHTGIKQFVL